MVATLFYIVSFLVFLSGLTMVKKTDKKMNIIVFGVVSLMTICCFQVLVTAIMDLIYIPINKLSLGIVNAKAGGLIWSQIIKKKETQAYYFDVFNVIAIGVLGIVLIWFIRRTCTFEFAPCYFAVDAAAHFRMAMGVVDYDAVYGMFFSAVHHGLFIDLLSPLVSEAVYYKLYVLSDMLHLMFAWVLFYCLIERYAKDTFLKIAAIIVSVVYAIGYPMNSTIFGFTYLGMGVAVISYLLIVYDYFVDDSFDKNYAIACLSLGCLGIFQSYVLFMPVTFFAILFGMFHKQWKAKKLVSLETIKYGLNIFLVPTILGFIFTYAGTFGDSTNTTVSGAIVSEGGIYRDLFSNFVILVPFVLCAFVYLIKDKKNKLVLWLMPLLLGFIFVLFMMGLKGDASTYYFYKNYYLLWLLAFEMFFIAISYFGKEIRLFLGFGFATWAAVFVAFWLNIEMSIYNKAPLFISSVKAGAYNDIFTFNRDATNVPCYSGLKLDMYRYVVEEIGVEDHVVAIASTWDEWYWFEVITGQSLDSGYYHWMFGEEVFFETLYEDADYVIATFDSTIYQNNVEKFEEMEMIRSSDLGALYKVK